MMYYGHFLFIQNFIFFVTIYTYKLLQAFPPKASVENSSAQWAILFFKKHRSKKDMRKWTYSETCDERPTSNETDLWWERDFEQ